MDWRGYRKLTLLFMVLSIITDATIVFFDGYVPRGTLTNLEGVIAVYVILAVLLLARPSWGLTITLVLSALWLLAQLGNAFFSSAPPGFTFPQGFTAYIFGYGAIPPNAAIGCPYGCPPFGYSALASIILQIPVILLAFMGRSAIRRGSMLKAATMTT